MHVSVDEPGQQARIRSEVDNLCPFRRLCAARVQVSDLPVLDENPGRASRALSVEYLPCAQDQHLTHRWNPARCGGTWLAESVIGLLPLAAASGCQAVHSWRSLPIAAAAGR